MFRTFLRRCPSEVAPDVLCLPLSIVNVALVGPVGAGDRQWTLVDAGLGFSGGAIRRAAAQRFGRNSRPNGIVLTHGHFDHVGALRELADEWDVPIFAHELELPYLTGRSSYPPPDPTVGGGAMTWMSPLYPRGPIDVGDRLEMLPADASIPGMDGWCWLHTPGHTPGHVSLVRAADRTMIAGDAFVTTRQESLLAVLFQQSLVWRPPAYYTTNWEQARDSVERLDRWRPLSAMTGHGVPLRGEELSRGLNTLVEQFIQWLPSTGRYVDQAAIANEYGRVSEHRPVSIPHAWKLPLLAGLVLLAGLTVILHAERQTSKRGR